MLLACLVTIAIETPMMYAFGYRSRDHVITVACANCATNLILNGLLVLLKPRGLWVIWVLEAAVVLGEWLIFTDVFGSSYRLFLKVLICNLTTAITGVLFFN